MLTLLLEPTAKVVHDYTAPDECDDQEEQGDAR